MEFTILQGLSNIPKFISKWGAASASIIERYGGRRSASGPCSMSSGF
jgi:hypothetical protein